MDLPTLSPAARLFAGVTDLRVERTRRHLLRDRLLLALCATLAGAESFADLEEWAEMKEGWLRTFLELLGASPAMTPLSACSAGLIPSNFMPAFCAGWKARQRLVVVVSHGKIAVDGKSLRRRFDTASGQKALPVVSAFAVGELSLVLGQVATGEKSNEITAIPELLRLLELKGAVVSIDAMGTQKEMAAQITAQDGDHLLALKGNHALLRDVRRLFADEAALAGQKPARAETIEEGSRASGNAPLHDSCRRRALWWAAWPGRRLGGRAKFDLHREPPRRACPGYGQRGAALLPQAACPLTPRGFWLWRGATGPLKTTCTGCWMSTSTKTAAGSGKIMARSAWPPCAGWP